MRRWHLSSCACWCESQKNPKHVGLLKLAWAEPRTNNKQWTTHLLSSMYDPTWQHHVPTLLMLWRQNGLHWATPLKPEKCRKLAALPCKLAELGMFRCCYTKRGLKCGWNHPQALLVPSKGVPITPVCKFQGSGPGEHSTQNVLSLDNLMYQLGGKHCFVNFPLLFLLLLHSSWDLRTLA